MPYRPVSLTEFVDMYNFGPSHMQWAARNSLAAHKDRGLADTDSAEALQRFLKKVGAHISLRAEVLTEENRPANPQLMAIDRRVDVTYSRFVRRIRMELDLYAPDTKRGQAAARMLDSPLGMPISAVTSVDRIEQMSMLKNIIKSVERDFSSELATLELKSHFQLLKDQTAQFVELMTLDSNRKRLPSRTELEEARKDLQAEMTGCMFRILGNYPNLTEKDLEMRTTLLGPFAIQNDRIGDYLRRRRGGGSPIPPAVDDETGEILEDREPASPTIEEPAPAVL